MGADANPAQTSTTAAAVAAAVVAAGGGGDALGGGGFGTGFRMMEGRSSQKGWASGCMFCRRRACVHAGACAPRSAASPQPGARGLGVWLLSGLVLQLVARLVAQLPLACRLCAARGEQPAVEGGEPIAAPPAAESASSRSEAGATPMRLLLRLRGLV